jgi:hypothetical protein
VRAEAVDYMRAHADDFSAYVAEEGAFDDYLSLMLKGRRGKPAWGDELTLRAMCNSFGATVHVLSSQEGKWYLKYVPEKTKTSKQVFLAYISPAHYNAFELAPVGSSTTCTKTTKTSKAKR